MDHLETIYGLILGRKLFSNSLNALKRSMSQVLDVRLQYGLLRDKIQQTEFLFSGKSQLGEDPWSTFVDPSDCLIVQVSIQLVLQEVDSVLQGGTVLRRKKKVSWKYLPVLSLPRFQTCRHPSAFQHQYQRRGSKEMRGK